MMPWLYFKGDGGYGISLPGNGDSSLFHYNFCTLSTSACWYFYIALSKKRITALESKEVKVKSNMMKKYLSKSTKVS